MERRSFYELKMLRIYSDWAKTPLEKGIRKSIDEIEATGLRYRVTERANNMAVGSWQGASGSSGFSGDFMTPFTKEFWNVKGRKRRARTLEVLRAYGDSTTVLIKEPVKAIKIKEKICDRDNCLNLHLYNLCTRFAYIVYSYFRV